MVPVQKQTMCKGHRPYYRAVRYYRYYPVSLYQVGIELLYLTFGIVSINYVM